MAYTNIWESKGLYRKFLGQISGEEILESSVELYSNPKFHKINYMIADFSNIEGYNVDPTHAKIMAQTDNMISRSRTVGKLKVAVVIIKNDDNALKLVQIYKSMTEKSNFTCEIFNSLSNAKSWVK